MKTPATPQAADAVAQVARAQDEAGDVLQCRILALDLAERGAVHHRHHWKAVLMRCGMCLGSWLLTA
ncbi:hypothetical protein KH5H1_12990 [Corallococcus caeni]|uniref:hypothetical protein n=1 Tax=Corallococcus caeni TaxID=3082388 RepID=UPI002956A6F3|nr:hypothetical protein KH5H1_12990 [Corallococcus sp. KH5-1]